MKGIHGFEKGLAEFEKKLFTRTADYNVYAIADGILILDLPQILVGEFSLDALALAPRLVTNDRRSGPYLFQVPESDSSVWQWLRQPDIVTTALFFHSTADISDLWLTLHPLTQARMPEGTLSWLRFYDPEILFPLAASAPAGLIGHYYGVSPQKIRLIEQWLRINEFGEVVTLTHPDTVLCTPETPQIYITPTQLEALEDGYFRRLCRLSIIHMQKRHPDVFETVSTRHLALVENAVEEAFERGLNEYLTTPWFVESAFRWGMAFANEPWALSIFNDKASDGYLKASRLYDKLHEGRQQ